MAGLERLLSQAVGKLGDWTPLFQNVFANHIIPKLTHTQPSLCVAFTKWLRRPEATPAKGVLFCSFTVISRLTLASRQCRLNVPRFASQQAVDELGALQ